MYVAQVQYAAEEEVNTLGVQPSRQMVQHFLEWEAHTKRQQSTQAMLQVSSLKQWMNRRLEIRQATLDALGGLPPQYPGNAALLGIVERVDYRIENIWLESLPGIPINLSLFIPKGKKVPMPAVLFTTGHLPKTHPMHQQPVLGLVKKGYAVALFDCYGRGERERGNEHFVAGVLSWLNGRCMNRYFIHDSMQVVDYLLTRGDIDPVRIGCAGASGGGNTAIFHAALDERVACVASVCTISSFVDLIDLQYSGCPEYYPVGLLQRGVDIQDIAALIAPRPHILIGGAKDELNLMPSLLDTVHHIQHIYQLYGKEAHLAYFIDPNGEHGCGPAMQRKLYDWMDMHLMAEEDRVPAIKEGSIEPDDALNFLPSPDSHLIAFEAAAMQRGRIVLESRGGVEDADFGMRGRTVQYRICEKNVRQQDGCRFICVILETDPGIFIPCRIWIPQGVKRPVQFSITVRENGLEAVPAQDGSSIAVAAQLRGTGSSRLAATPWDHLGYCSAARAVAGGAIVLGYPLAVQQAYDLLAVLQFLQRCYDGIEHIQFHADAVLAVAVRIACAHVEDSVDLTDVPQAYVQKVFSYAMEHETAGILVEEEPCSYQEIVSGAICVDREGEIWN